jgi:hypothetical protein
MANIYYLSPDMVKTTEAFIILIDSSLKFKPMIGILFLMGFAYLLIGLL